jgi:Right handed beta helix region
VEELCDLGVDNSAGHHGVTVEDGSIRDFVTGVFAVGANHNRLRDVSVSQSFLAGVLVGQSVDTRIERNSISANGLETDEAGLIVFDSEDVVVDSNAVWANGDIGMALAGVVGSRVERNSVFDHPEAGLLLEGASTYVARNDVARSGDGIILVGDANRVVRNDIVDPSGCPDVAGCGVGISFEGGVGNRIARNLVLRAEAVGIRVMHFPPETPVPVRNEVRRNVVRRGGDDGIFVAEGAERTQVIRNKAGRNHGDGIDVDAPATKLARNRANRNRELGIEAVKGVRDSGGNRARHNGLPRQCTHVSCN